jgi:hypothetical protein
MPAAREKDEWMASNKRVTAVDSKSIGAGEHLTVAGRTGSFGGHCPTALASVKGPPGKVLISGLQISFFLSLMAMVLVDVYRDYIAN